MHHCFFFLLFYLASSLFYFLYSNLTGKNKIHIFSSPPSFSVWGLCTLLSWKESGCSPESTSELTALQPGRCLIRNILELLSETQPSLNVYSCEPVGWREFEREMVCWCVCVCVIVVIGAGLIRHISDATHILNEELRFIFGMKCLSSCSCMFNVSVLKLPEVELVVV